MRLRNTARSKMTHTYRHNRMNITGNSFKHPHHPFAGLPKPPRYATILLLLSADLNTHSSSKVINRNEAFSAQLYTSIGTGRICSASHSINTLGRFLVESKHFSDVHLTLNIQEKRTVWDFNSCISSWTVLHTCTEFQISISSGSPKTSSRVKQMLMNYKAVLCNERRFGVHAQETSLL